MTLEGWIWYTTTTNNKDNNNKNPRKVWIRWNGARSVQTSVRKKEKFHWLQVCWCIHAAFCTIPKEWKWGLLPTKRALPPDFTPLDFVLGPLKNAVYATKPQTLEELRDQIQNAFNNISLAKIHTYVVALFGVVVGSVLWQKVNILNMCGLRKFNPLLPDGTYKYQKSLKYI